MEQKDNIVSTVKEMLACRGYEIVHTENDRIMAKKPDDSIVCVFTSIITDFGIDSLRICIGILQRMEIKHGIIIYSGGITPSARTLLKTSNDIMTLESFSVSDLQFNPMKHRLVPKMSVLSTEDAKQFKEKYGTQIPKIKHNDPIVRFMGWKRGDIVYTSLDYNIVV